MSGRGRRGAPPLPRQRAALRVVQLTLVALGIVLALMAVPSRGVGRGETTVLGAGALLSVASAVAMGLRTVRGPRPPDL